MSANGPDGPRAPLGGHEATDRRIRPEAIRAVTRPKRRAPGSDDAFGRTPVPNPFSGLFDPID